MYSRNDFNDVVDMIREKHGLVTYIQVMPPGVIRILDEEGSPGFTAAYHFEWDEKNRKVVSDHIDVFVDDDADPDTAISGLLHELGHYLQRNENKGKKSMEFYESLVYTNIKDDKTFEEWNSQLYEEEEAWEIAEEIAPDFGIEWTSTMKETREWAFGTYRESFYEDFPWARGADNYGIDYRRTNELR